jgi:hypothetical protein
VGTKWGFDLHPLDRKAHCCGDELDVDHLNEEADWLDGPCRSGQQPPSPVMSSAGIAKGTDRGKCANIGCDKEGKNMCSDYKHMQPCSQPS